MNHQYSPDRTGYAQFSDDGLMRYHLMRMVSPRAREVGVPLELEAGGFTMAHASAKPRERLGAVIAGMRIALFVLLNPSNADAFKPDPTLTNCVKFTLAWGFDITWIVNLNAYRSPWPRDLKRRAVGYRGDDHVNNTAILTACRCADLVIAGWGLDGAMDRRDQLVMSMLRLDAIQLHHMGLTKEGYPKHPSARGVHRIPATQPPIQWVMDGAR